jgi:hypothetical protein
VPIWWRLTWIAAVAGMPLVTLWLIVQNGENVPVEDDLFMIPLFRAHDEGTLGFGEFWAVHNEHRPLVPRAVDFGLGLLTRWDLRVELYRNFAVAVAILAVIVAAMRRTLDRTALVAASIVASVVLFSPVHWENWLWGWQLEWWLSNLAALGALWSLSSGTGRAPRRAMACALVASLSLGQGLLVWPVGLALLLLRRRPWRAWTLLGAGTYVAYFIGWENPSTFGSKTAFLERPLDFADFVTECLGRSLATGGVTANVVGAVVAASFLAAAGHVLFRRRDPELSDRAAFWLGTGLYALGGALLIGIARVEAGDAARSRYAVVAALLAIGTLGLILAIARARGVAARRLALAAVALPLLLAGLVNAPHGAESMDATGRYADGVAACTQRARTAADPCLAGSVYAAHFDWIVYVRRKGWAGYEPPD